VSDDCYETSGTANLFIWPPLQALASMPRIDCVGGQARDDLFVDARPDYLMNAEERAAADAEFQRRERLRRPTTGVVMAPR
jgi:hypothetical protein